MSFDVSVKKVYVLDKPFYVKSPNFLMPALAIQAGIFCYCSRIFYGMDMLDDSVL